MRALFSAGSAVFVTSGYFAPGMPEVPLPVPSATVGASCRGRGWCGRMKQIGLWGPPTPPTLRSMIASLRGLNRIFDGPIVVAINGKGVLVVLKGEGPIYGNESLPGSGQKFDAVASARRLLAALRDLEPSSAS